MRFTLTYRGLLKADGSPKDKQLVRRSLHPQLAALWRLPPLQKLRSTMLDPVQTMRPSVIAEVGPFRFAPLVSRHYQMAAKLHITFLRPGPPGSLLTQGGDIDNRLKTLFDALRMPDKLSELPKSDVPRDDEDPFFCVLEDDSLITDISLSTDTLLAPAGKNDVDLMIQVETRILEPSFYNLPLA